MKAKRPKLPRQGFSLLKAMNQFLTPEVWKQGHAGNSKPNLRRNGSRKAVSKSVRWTLQPLVTTLLLMSFCAGESQAERFEMARAVCGVQLAKRRRPGSSRSGFQKALRKMPVATLRALAFGVRKRQSALFGEALMVDGFVPLGVDGSRLECPRSAELERRLPSAGKTDSAPTLWVTCLVHLGKGLLWSWRIGRGTASERAHLMTMLPVLPPSSLVVADAGFNGFFQAQAIVNAGASFLIRMSSKVRLLTEEQADATTWSDGEVYYWPREAQDAKVPPMRVRLICIRDRTKKKDVWLLTDVLDAGRLSVRTTSKLYRWRWENESFFRSYKRTLSNLKMRSRTVASLHREAEASLLATQLLLASGALALQTPAANAKKGKSKKGKSKTSSPASPYCSPRKVLLGMRRNIIVLLGSSPHYRRAQRKDPADAARDRRTRTSGKTRRSWPRRKDHKPPNPPILLPMTEAQKAKKSRIEDMAA